MPGAPAGGAKRGKQCSSFSSASTTHVEEPAEFDDNEAEEEDVGGTEWEGLIAADNERHYQWDVSSQEPPLSKHSWAVSAGLAAERARAQLASGLESGRRPGFLPWLLWGDRALDARWTLRAFMVVLLTVLFSTNMLALGFAKRAGGNTSFQFEYVTVTLLQETSKMCITLTLWSWEQHGSSQGGLGYLFQRFRSRGFLAYGVPGLLYCLENNFQYVILTFLQPAELAVIWNFKIFATVILLHLFLHRRYARHQWVAMAVLVIGCILTQAPIDSSSVHANMHPLLNSNATSNIGRAQTDAITTTPAPTPTAVHLKLIGTVLAVIGSTIAASSNVFCEWLMQRSQESIHVQNLQLYFFGVLLNSFMLLSKAVLDRQSPVHGPGGFFTGYTSWTWTIVALGSVSGLAISCALKFVDNLVIIFSHALGVVSVAALSARFFDTPLSPPFVLGGAFIMFALLVFHSSDLSTGGASANDGKLPHTSMADSFNKRKLSSDLGAEATSPTSGGGSPGSWRRLDPFPECAPLGRSNRREIPMYCIT